MIKRLLRLIYERHSLEKLDIKDFSRIKTNGMRFTVRAFEAKGLGHVSIMTGSGYLGLMRMDTVMVVPREKDLPLYSYDRIYAMGNDTLIVELYDTLLEPANFNELEWIKKKYKHIPERDPGLHWYDSIKLKESISKKAKKEYSDELDELALAHFEAYLDTIVNKVDNKDLKLKKTKKYVKDLLANGGPSTDVFIESFGKRQTERFFKRALFGTDK
ncbi:MAG: hypothetical protein Q4C49_05600 [Bacillota bacterium]|nr:hypothetical protein [Bacillota bacterium]